MDQNTLILIAVGIVVVILGLWLLGIASAVFIGAVATATSLFAWAAESGFIGVALYVIVWVVATPLMIIVCLIGGVIRAIDFWLAEREEKQGH